MLFLVRLLINATALWIAVRTVPGLAFDGPLPMLLIVAFVFAAVNAIVRPILKFLTFPILIVSLGLFIFVINALMLWLTATVSDAFGFGFHVVGFKAAFLGALVVSLVSLVLGWVARPAPTRE
jgi:putative membrane protein